MTATATATAHLEDLHQHARPGTSRTHANVVAVDRPGLRPRYRPQRISVPDLARPAFYAAATTAMVTFAVFGLFTSLTPVVLNSLRVTSPAVTGLAAFLVFGSAALAQIVLARLSPRAQLLLGLSLLAVGMVVLTAAVRVASLALFARG